MYLLYPYCIYCVFYQQFSMKYWLQKKCGTIYILVHFPVAYTRFQNLYSTYICSIVLCTIIIDSTQKIAYGLGPATEPYVCQLLAVQIWAYPLTSLGFSFLITQIKILITSVSWGSFEDLNIV
jgi:hypothetical protein